MHKTLIPNLIKYSFTTVARAFAFSRVLIFSTKFQQKFHIFILSKLYQKVNFLNNFCQIYVKILQFLCSNFTFSYLFTFSCQGNIRHHESILEISKNIWDYLTTSVVSIPTKPSLCCRQKTLKQFNTEVCVCVHAN